MDLWTSHSQTGYCKEEIYISLTEARTLIPVARILVAAISYTGYANIVWICGSVDAVSGFTECQTGPCLALCHGAGPYRPT
jgi:hypothetical protein